MLSALLSPQALNAQSIALAGLFQSLEQVQRCARDGEPSDPQATRVVLHSILRIDAADAQSVYGDLSGLRAGLTLLAQHLSRRTNTAHVEQTRYAVSLMGLERRLVKSTTIATQLTADLREIENSRDSDGHAVDAPSIVQQLAASYAKHVSPLGPRVMISGEPVYLQTSANADRIRALLLAGLRSTVLWRQCGGQQLKLLLFRKPMLRAVDALLNSPL